MIDEEIFVPKSSRPRLVVVGSGFAGINLAKHLKNGPFQIVLLERNNFHQFQPLLYQVATCGLEPDAIIFPTRKLFEGYKDFYFRMGEVERVDTEQKRLHTNVGWLNYDKLVLATGSASNFFGNKEVEERGIGMKNIREALDIRSIVLQNLEHATRTQDESLRDALTNFVVVGGGPAGVETAGALAEFKRYILQKDYPELDLDMMNIYLIQSGDRVLKGMSEKASIIALRELEHLGVEMCLDMRVTHYNGRHVSTNTERSFKAKALIWTAGVQGDVPQGVLTDDRSKRIAVDNFCRVKDTSDVYAIGDVAQMISDQYPDGLPMVAPTAIQQGAFLAKHLKHDDFAGPGFQYKNKGSLATIGKRRAVADLGNVTLSGFPAWSIWCFVHVASLIGFRNKFFVLMSWVISYFTYEKGNRFIVRKYTQTETE
jgi:NADH dehydrogenase